MPSPTATTPLNPSNKPSTTDNSPPPKPLSSFITTEITALGLLRIVAGGACLLAPTLTGRIFHIPIGPQSIILARMFGIRDVVLGELLLTADKSGKEQKELKRALWAGVATDVVDVGSCAFALASGTLSRTGAGLLGGGAAVFALMGAGVLRSL